VPLDVVQSTNNRTILCLLNGKKKALKYLVQKIPIIKNMEIGSGLRNSFCHIFYSSFYHMFLSGAKETNGRELAR
jgi:hypothetical protein